MSVSNQGGNKRKLGDVAETPPDKNHTPKHGKLEEETVDSGHGTDDKDCSKCKTIVRGIKSSQHVLSMHVDIRSICTPQEHEESGNGKGGNRDRKNKESNCPPKTKDSSGSPKAKAVSAKKMETGKQQKHEGSKKEKKEKLDRKKKEKDRIFERICALRNSRGGILLIHFTHMKDSDKFLGLVDQLIDDRLNELIGDGTLFHESYFRDWQENEPHCLSITCNPSSTISTTNYNTHINLNKGLARPTLLNMRYILSKDRSCGEYKEKSISKLQEAFNVQLKSFIKAQNVARADWATYIMEGLRLREFISSFANQKGGGYYFLGVAEQDDREIDAYKTRKVFIEGFELKEIDHENLKSEILDHIVSEMLFLTQDISIIDRDAITKTLKFTFHKTEDQEDSNMYVLEVYVHPFSGVVFFDREGPESYLIDENNCIQRVKPQVWRGKVLEQSVM